MKSSAKDSCMSTCREEDISVMRAFIARKKADKKARNHALWQQACQDAGKIRAMIIAGYSPKAIYQWGSVLDGASFSEISDIDIAVEGVSSTEAFFDLIGKAEGLTDFPVDIVEIERVEPEYARLIKTHGRCVYRKETGHVSG